MLKHASPAQAQKEQQNKSQATGLQRLSKDSKPNELKIYFGKIFELRRSGKEFPVNLNEVWPLVYGRKQEAVRVLKSEFIEGEDFIAQKPDSERLRKNAQSGGDLKNVDYYLSVPCLEYFIAKRMKPVFDVYRKVFHRVADGFTVLPQNASPYQERTVTTVPMGDWTNKVWVEDGIIYAGASTLMKYIGYRDGISMQYVNRIGVHYYRSVQVDHQKHWFINYQGFSRLLEISRVIPAAKQLEAIQRMYDVYVEKAKEDVTGYHFNMSEGFDILQELAKTPVRKHRVIELFIKGAKKGRVE